MSLRRDRGSPGRLCVLGIYPWNRFWSMGEFKGAPSFFLAPQALVRAGHDVHLSMPAGGEVPLSGPQASGTGAEEYYGMKLHRYRLAINFMSTAGGRLYVHLTRPFRYLYYLMRGASAGFSAARACKPDVVVGYGAWAAPVAFLVARPLGLPTVTRLFGQSLPSGGKTGLRGAVRTFLNYPEIIAFLTRCSVLIVCNDGSGGDKVAEWLGVPAGRVRFWRNGVDKELFHRAEDRRRTKADLGLDPDAPLLLSVSRLDAEKHHERLVQALPEVLKSFPAALAFIIGEGPQRPYLEAEAFRLGVSSSVRLPGAMSQEELAQHYRACDIFLSLSDRTNIANTTIEAMCCGACVVALDAGDTSKAICAGENAILIRKEDLPGLGNLLAGLLGDGPKRAALGERAAAFAVRSVPSIAERSQLEAEAVAAAAREPAESP